MLRQGSTMLCAAFLLATTQPPAFAQPATAAPSTPSDIAGDALSSPTFHGAEVVAFMGVKPADRVADILAGRFARLLSQTVGPKGKVYAVEPDEVVRVHPEMLSMMKGLSTSADYGNIEVVTGPVDRLALPPRLDVVFIRQNYHDLHDRFMGPADVARFNREVFRALKPGGVYVVLDHAAAAGSGLSETQRLHRIDPASVIAEITAAGFTLDAQSPVLANPEDSHDKLVFDPSIRGHTDQFLLRFRKPG